MAELTFKDKKIDFNRLVTFGFQPSGTSYTYQTPIVDNQFLLTITATKPNQLTTHVTDMSTNEEYVLHLTPQAHGKFVGKVATAYQQVLDHIEADCMNNNVFQAAQVQAVMTHVEQTYGDQLEFLWQKFPKNAVWRRADTHKWYGVLLTVQRQKLGLDSTEEVTVLDLRAQPEVVERLVDNGTYFPGYHMNKRNWFTIILDGSVPMPTIIDRLKTSYQLAK